MVAEKKKLNRNAYELFLVEIREFEKKYEDFISNYDLSHYPLSVTGIEYYIKNIRGEITGIALKEGIKRVK